MYLVASPKRLEDEYKDPDALPKVNKKDMAGTMESDKEYLRSCCDVLVVPLAYIIRETIIAQTYGNYLAYVTPSDKMVAKILHSPPGKNRLHGEQSVQSVKECTVEYEIDNRSVYKHLGSDMQGN